MCVLHPTSWTGGIHHMWEASYLSAAATKGCKLFDNMQKSSVYDVIQSHKGNPPQEKPSTRSKREKTYWHPRSPSCCAFAVTLSYSQQHKHPNLTLLWLFYKGSHAMLPSVLAPSRKNCLYSRTRVVYSILQMYYNVLESTLVKNISLIFSLDYVQATFLWLWPNTWQE